MVRLLMATLAQHWIATITAVNATKLDVKLFDYNVWGVVMLEH